ncbi:MAG: glutamate mutase L, partial [bacterium]
MISNSHEAGSMLALDLGSFTTRASLIDVVDGQYRLIAAGEARTSAGSPHFDIRIGAAEAVRQIEAVIDRQLVDRHGTLIMPLQASGNGFDSLVILYSCVPELKIAAAGLVNEISLESAQHLVSGIYGKTVEIIGLQDRRDTA